MNAASFRAILVLSAQDNMSRTVNAALNNASTRLEKFGARAMATGRGMLLGGGILAAPFVMGAKAAIDYQSAFTGVEKTWRGTESQLEGVNKEIVAMSKAIPSTAIELAEIAAQGNQLGIQSANVTKFTRTIADLRSATNLGEEAAPQLAQFANITRMAQGDFDKLGSTVVALGNNMATTERDIVNFGMRIAGAGAQVDIPQSKIMGLAAGLSSVGLEAEAGGTAISKTLIELSNRAKTGGKGLEEVARIAGMTGPAFRKAFQDDAANATVTFIEGLGRIKKEGGNTFAVLEQLGMGEVRLRDTLLRASGAGDLLRKSLDISATAWQENNNALTREAELRYNTTASKMKIFKNNVTALAIELGTAMLPTLNSLVASLQSVTAWVSEVSEKYPRLTKFVVGATAAFAGFLLVGGAVAYTVGTISRIASAATTAISALGNVTKVVTGIQWLWNAAMAANPIGLIVAGVIAAVAAVTTLIVYWDELKAKFMAAPAWMKVVVGIASTFFLPIIAIAGAVRFLIDNWDDLPGAIGRAVTGAGKWLLSLLPKVASVVGKIIGFVVTLPVQIPMLMGRAIMAAGRAIIGAAPALWQSAKDTFNGIVDAVLAIPGKLFEAGKNIVNSLVDGMKSVAMAPIDFISGLAEDIMSFLPFSPAKKGPFKRIMDVQIVQSIAKGMRPAPMIGAMHQAAGATMAAANGQSPSTGGGSSTAAPIAPARGRGGVVINIANKVTIEGHADPKQIEEMLLKAVPKMIAEAKRLWLVEQRGSFSAG